jgi:putative membrane protein (TIGR04086 family)
MFRKNESDEKLYMIYIKAVSRGIIISVVLLLITALVFYFTDFNQDNIKTIVWAVTILSICYSGIYAAAKAGSRGYLHGAASGAIYMLVLFIIAALAERGSISFRTYAVMFIMSLVIGSLSGMIGMIIGNKN